MDELERPQPWAHWRLPLSLGGLGLALLLAGYFLLQAEGRQGPRSPEQQQELQRLREMAKGDPELTRRIDQITGSRWAYLLGVLAFWTGLLLFLVAVVQMYRQPSHSDEEAPETEEAPEVSEEEQDQSWTSE